MNSTIDAYKLLTLVYSKPGLLSQDDIVNLTGYSKSKVSRLCADACTAGLIHKIQHGKTWTYSYGPVIQEIIKPFKERR